MQNNHTTQQIRLRILSFVMAFFILFAGAAGFRPAYADGPWDDDGFWDDSGSWDDDGTWDNDGTWDDDGYWDDEGYWDDDGSWVAWDEDDLWPDDTVYGGYPEDYDFYDVSVEGGMGIFSASDEAYLREEDVTDEELDEDEFRSFYVTVKNNNPADRREVPVYYRVDGGIEQPFSDALQQEGGLTQYHVDLEKMAILDPGLHEVEVFVNDEAVCTHRFYVERDWDEIMPEPTEEQINEVEPLKRSPYVVYYPSFAGTKGLKEYSVDLSIDKMDKGTYVSTICGYLNIDTLKENGLETEDNFGAPGGVYTGIQCWEDGKTGFIMSVWDVISTDAQGNKQIIKATPLYADEKAVIKSETSENSGEGDFQQLKIEYPFDERHPYRTLMQLGTNEANGNTTLTMQVCDLVSQEWKKIVTWDLGYSSKFLRTEDLTGFLENYLTQYNGSVRSANLSNIRGLDSATGEWVAADSVKFTVNNSMGDDISYTGSYQFGADENSYYAITSGVNGLCKSEETGTTFSVKNPTAEKPY